jgi:hypothetical protein
MYEIGEKTAVTTDQESRVTAETKRKSMLENVAAFDDMTADMFFTFFRRHPVVEHIVLTELNYSNEDNYKIRFSFDRTFKSTMYTPDHLTFLSILPVFQKIYYYFLLERFDRKDEAGKEGFKIWPYSLNIRIPKLITKTKDLKGEITEHNLRDLGKRTDNLYKDAQTYLLNITMVIEDSMVVDTNAMIYDLMSEV